MIKESVSSIGQDSKNLNLHICPVCGLTYLIPEEQCEVRCSCGTIFDTSPECLLQELMYSRIEDIKIEGVFEVPERAEFDLDYCNTCNE